MEQLFESARRHLHKACTSTGIMAALEAGENYDRLWTRDAVMAGVAGCLHRDHTIMEGLGRTIDHLTAGQGAQGQIPSNLSMDGHGNITQISFGTLAPRLDCLSWFIIGAALVEKFQLSKNQTGITEAAVIRAIDLLEALEYNGKGLIYLPLGGNWADEYLVHGYTLSDQLLRARALQMAGDTWGKPSWTNKANAIHEKVAANFWIVDNDPAMAYWVCSTNPAGYNPRFDLMGNALAISAGLGGEPRIAKVLNFVEHLMENNLKRRLLPAFWPIIYPGDADWERLKNYCLYRFKNEPGHYHNGGIWPMLLGWFGLAAQKVGRPEFAGYFLDELATLLYHHQEGYSMWEYFSSITFHPGGVKKLSYTATGILLLEAVIKDRKIDIYI